MLRPGPTITSRPAILALAFLVWLASPIGASRARASGCHLGDRPVLGVDRTDSLERLDVVLGISVATIDAPPILTGIPCPVESAHVSPITTLAAEAARLPSRLAIPRTPSGTCLPVIETDFLDPFPCRLDRPPR